MTCCNVYIDAHPACTIGSATIRGIVGADSESTAQRCCTLIFSCGISAGSSSTAPALMIGTSLPAQWLSLASEMELGG
jgi:hypothetical protein